MIHDKMNTRTQELTQSDQHQAPKTTGKDRQIQKSSHKINRQQAELATLSHKGGNCVTQTKLNIQSTYIIIKRKTLENKTLHDN